ncbi:Protein of unknown function [Oceanobacillus limi]|uniref:DUF1878 domain-containing protein n=1 Tax=Oceanobacillus limi TaxID=930131 RepID=A0A1H9YKY9_9BACI|nr:DUF1878 family protein [Oceanobacillus limi]SES69633.1 Protein of unknown function [Oceanobacillus limi]
MKSYSQGDTAMFHLQLLSKTIDLKKYPFTKLIIEKNITNEEYNDLLELLHVLNQKYELQKEEGLLDFSSLLINFAGMLNEKLHPDETILALKKEGYYHDLMDSFLGILNEKKRFK